MGSRVRSFTWALRSRARSPASVQLLWMGPQTPSGPQGLFTMPVLSPEHEACATWPALVTFQATVEESSGQVVSPSKNDIREGLAAHSSLSFSLRRNPCRLWSLVVLPSSGRHPGGAPRVAVRGRPAGSQVPHTLDDGDRDGDPERAQTRALQLTNICGVGCRAVLNSQHEALGVRLVEYRG